MDKAQELKDGLAAAEAALGAVVHRYRLALGCCYSCGDHFELGDVATVVVDEDGHVGFEHEECFDDADDYRSDYRNPRQLDP